MSTIDEIKTRLDIVDLVSETVQLRRSGKNYTGFCPFHSNTRTPAFVVFPETGTWRCFGQCSEGGDIFGFVMKKEGWDFSETLRFLADKAGVELKPLSPGDQAAAEEHDQLRVLLEEAVTFYRHQLLQTPAGQIAADYLRGRGLKDETIEAFGLGYAPQSWETATEYFKSKGYPETTLKDAGLVSEHDSGSVYDRFRHRVMIPIRDERGRMAGFGARILNPEDVPKFINSPQTVIFDKGRLLYGLDQARKAIRSVDQAVIVEGYLDVIALHQAGYNNAVSPMGTALSEHQFHLLTRFSRRLVLALDPDAAGDKATLRGLQVARQSLEREADPVFDARGLLGFEARLQADIRVTTLPEGLDPDEVVLRNPQEWVSLLENANPVVIHVMEALAAGRDLEDPKTRSEIASQVLPLIADVPDPVERDTYRQRLARLLKVDERALMVDTPRSVARSRRRGSRRLPARQAEAELVPALGAGYPLEAYALGVLLRFPEFIYQVDRELQQHSLSRLSAEDFLNTDHQALLRLLQKSVDQDHADPSAYILNCLSLEMMEVADKLLAGTAQFNLQTGAVLPDLLRALLDIRQRNVRQEIEYLRYLMETVQEQGDLRATQYQQSMVQLIQVLRHLDQAKAYYTNRSLSGR